MNVPYFLSFGIFHKPWNVPLFLSFATWHIPYKGAFSMPLAFFSRINCTRFTKQCAVIVFLFIQVLHNQGGFALLTMVWNDLELANTFFLLLLTNFMLFPTQHQPSNTNWTAILINRYFSPKLFSVSMSSSHGVLVWVFVDEISVHLLHSNVPDMMSCLLQWLE